MELKEKYKEATESNWKENKHCDGWPRHELKKEEDFLLNIIPNMIDNEPEKFRLSLYVGIIQKYGTYGSERIKLLKDSFKTIIEEIFPIDFKFYVAIMNEASIKEIIKSQREKIKYNRKPYKFCKESTDESIMDNLK